MKRDYQILTILFLLALTFQSCSPNNTSVITDGTMYKETRPDNVDIFLDGKKPERIYKEIGFVKTNSQNMFQ